MILDALGGIEMKKILLACAALVAQIAGPAVAADLPIKVAYGPPPTPVVYSWWTGCYLGGNVGGAWSRANYSYDNSVAVEGFSFKPVSLIGGGHVGCQYEWKTSGYGAFVFGIEGTWSKAHFQKSQTSVLFPTRDRSLTIDNIVTVTGKLGYAWDRTMIYGKAGWAGVRVSASTVNFAVPTDFATWSNSWTVGMGLEYVPWQSIILGVEANYYRATFDHAGTDSAGSSFCGRPTATRIFSP